ncbi:MAG: site-2 protease family protein [Actinomycetota bacterium]|nr:site-2 protease family protein [Actinomycetota bacterium]
MEPRSFPEPKQELRPLEPEPAEPPSLPQPERDYRPIEPEPAWRALARRIWAPLVAAGVLLAKFKWLLLAVFKFKIFTTSASMLVSVAAYALIWGWKFAVGFVLLIFVHELGHVLELRRQGVPASAPLFIPFLGAVVGMKQLPDDAWKEARVALAGPILGSVAAAGVWVAAEALDSEFLLALAFVGFLLNLFNLLPIVPLDGGRAVAAIHPALWLLGLAGLLALAVLRPNPILLLVLVFGGLELWRRWRERETPQAAAYYRIRPWQRVATGLVYGGLVVTLAIAMSATHVDRDL